MEGLDSPGAGAIPATPGLFRVPPESDFEQPPQVRHLTDAFRITGGSFNGESEYEGQIFCTRFEGVVACHPHAKFSRTFDDFGTEGYTLNAFHNRVIYHALMPLCAGSALKTVSRYPDDGVAAFRALRRSVLRSNLPSRLPFLQRKAMDIVIPTHSSPEPKLNEFVDTQTAISRVIDLPAALSIASLKNLLPVDYAGVVQAFPPDGNLDSLVMAVIYHYDMFLSDQNIQLRPTGAGPVLGSETGLAATVAAIQSDVAGLSVAGGNYNQRGGRGGNGGRLNGESSHSDGCFCCGSTEHCVRDCKHREVAKAAARAAAAKEDAKDSATAAAVNHDGPNLDSVSAATQPPGP